LNSRRILEVAAMNPGATPATVLEAALCDPFCFTYQDLYEVEVAELLQAVSHLLQSDLRRGAIDQRAAYAGGLGELADAKIDELRSWQRRQGRDRAHLTGKGTEELDPADRARHLLTSALHNDIERARRDGSVRGRRERWPTGAARPKSAKTYEK
jgi:hypothetical protein